MQYYVRNKGKTTGPYSIDRLRSMHSSGAFNDATQFCGEGSNSWYSLPQFENYLDASRTEIQTAGKTWTKQKIWAVSAVGAGAAIIVCGFPTIGTALICAGGLGFIAAQFGGWGTRK